MNRTISYFCKIFLAPIATVLFIKGVQGKNNFPKHNFILASNHQSYLDIVISCYVCVPRRFVFIGQIDKGRGILGAMRDGLYYIGGVIRLNRFCEVSKKQAIDSAKDHLLSGYSLIIYPEGKRSLDGKIQKGKWGTAKLFLQTGVPIVPARIDGSYELFPPKGKMKVKRNITMVIGKPLELECYFEKAKNLDVDSEEYKNICIEVTDKLMEAIGSLSY